MRLRFAVAFLLTVLTPALLAARPARAAWPNDPLVNVPVCTAAGSQNDLSAIADGAGGVIAVWFDGRGGVQDIYAHRVLTKSGIHPSWPENGLGICTFGGTQQAARAAPDGAGGAIIAWYDVRYGDYDIYVQHALANGTADPAWPVNGRLLFTGSAGQFLPVVVSDGAGGAIIAWEDNRGSSYDIYAHHMLASGAPDPAWPATGRAICTAANTQAPAGIVSDGAGGAIITWADPRGATSDIYAHRVLSSGAVDPAWPADGRALCTAADAQTSPVIVSDGAGGAIVAWTDRRNGANPDIYAQHVLASGAVDAAWPADGRALCTAANYQQLAAIVSDGAAGAIVAWTDNRGATGYDVYAQHVLSGGAVDAAWPVDGRALCTAIGNQSGVAIASDGAKGAIVAWMDARAGATTDIYAQRVLANGAVDPGWPADGRAVCTAAGIQSSSSIVADPAGGAIVSWLDYRAGSDGDIYTQRVTREGYLGSCEPGIAGVADVPFDQGGFVKLSWDASSLEGSPYNVVDQYRVFRSVPTLFALAALERGDRARLDWNVAPNGGAPGWFTTTMAGSTIYWEFVATVAANFLTGYSYLVPTAFDSTAGGNPMTLFMVQARATMSNQHWESAVDSSYSVDNLAPAAPAQFTGEYAIGQTTLHWKPVREADLAGYRLYRGHSASFEPGPESMIAALDDTGFVDLRGGPYYYKLTAVDVHGNESPVAFLLPDGTVDVAGETIGGSVEFARPVPNPAREGAMLRFTLPVRQEATLAIFDVSGRLVRVLERGTLEAGEHRMTWDLRDESGRSVAPGLYVARLECGERRLARRIAVTR
jgi:hypothetical protein